MENFNQLRFLACRLKRECEIKNQEFTSILGQVRTVLDQINYRYSGTDKENVGSSRCHSNGSGCEVDQIMSYRQKLETLSANLRSNYDKDSQQQRCLRCLEQMCSVQSNEQNIDLYTVTTLLKEIKSIIEENSKLKEEIENSINTGNRHIAEFQVLLSMSPESKIADENKCSPLIDNFVKQHVNLKRFPLRDQNK